ncbi:hypothetical protein GCM10007047_22110 [Cerasicoccus arenae]|uniref:Glycosyl transferase family 1 domain-containing protein n=2 Tax=Cerasicoccus arenae TaxID=424488 RepID=A0A8J3DI24_9BACT|nr:hypothetical protein GCM10007047_22110 [Cerasicoccus arenae]
MAGPLMERGHKVSILIQDTEENRLRVQLECPTVHAYYIKAGGVREDLKARIGKVNEIKPDCVWVCGPGIRNFVTKIKGCPEGLVIADHSELLSAIKNRHFFRRAYDYLVETFFASVIQEHVVSSVYLRDNLKRRLRMLGRKVDPFYFPYAFNSKVMLTENSSINKSIVSEHARYRCIVYLGTFSENYGIFDMIRAISEVSKNYSDVRLILMGQGREEERAKILVKELGLEEHVKFAGYVPEELLATYCSLAYAFICPLRDTVQDWARCPSKLYLYLPYRKPIITCKIGEAAQMFKQEDYLYQPGDLKSMARAIGKTLSDEAIPLGVDPSMHTWEARVDAFLDWVSVNHPRLTKV